MRGRGDHPFVLPDRLPAIVLPPVGSPRLIVAAADRVGRYRWSRYYQASRPAAKVVRWFCRGFAIIASGRSSIHEGVVPVERWVTSPEAVVVLQDDGERGRWRAIVASGAEGVFLKVVKSGDAAALMNEAAMLEAVGDSLAPRVVELARALEGYAVLATQLLEGEWHRRDLVPPDAVIRLLRSLESAGRVRLRDHPWVLRLGATDPSGAYKQLLDVLDDRDWAVVATHGDCAPWNVLVLDDGTVRMVDWEFGCLDGLPGVDEAHWILQVAALVRGASPERCVHAYEELMRAYPPEGLSLTRGQSRALIGLTALWDSLEQPSRSKRLTEMRREVVRYCV